VRLFFVILILFVLVQIAADFLFSSSHHNHVCQIGVMTDFEIITLTQDGAVDFKTISVFLFSKFNRHPFFFSRSKSKALSVPSFANRQINYTRNTIILFMIIYELHLGTSLHSF